jgi:hypothetical protein
MMPKVSSFCYCGRTTIEIDSAARFYWAQDTKSAGLPDFTGYNTPKWENRRPHNKPNDHKIFQWL